jgi:deoxyribonuclease-4
MSAAGGLVRAVERGSAAGCQAIQIFTKNSNQWRAKPLEDEEAVRFREELVRRKIQLAFAHDSYLINLASPDPVLLGRSREAFLDEMERAEKLGLQFVVLHPGAHLGTGETAGIRRASESFDWIFERTPGCRVRVLIETTAGQGTNLGYRFEEIHAMIDGVKEGGRLGVCVDTCHLFAAGYDLRTRGGYEKTFDDFERVVGLERIQAFHLNDSKKPLGSRVDRHEHIGKGCLGLEPFRLLLNDPRFRGLPMVLETPKGKDDAWDLENLRILRGLLQ